MLTGWRLTLSKCFIIPQRYVLGLMGFFAVVNAYNMRICLSVAITAMTAPLSGQSDDDLLGIVDPDTCPSMDSDITEDDIDVSSNLYDWDDATRGWILSSFYWGYVITHMPGGVLAEKFGGKYSLGLGILGTAIFTLLTPIFVKYGGWQGLIAVRVLEGLGEGTTYPALNAMLSKWVPLNERAKIGTLVYAGGQIGTIVGNSISGWLIKETGSWESVFYFFGAVGVLWCIVWTLICYSEPDQHPFISDEERNYLAKEIGSKAIKKDDLIIPWRAILTSVPLWALVAAQIGHDWGFFTMVTDLPLYMSDVLRFKIDENGVLSSVPYVGMWIVSMLSAWLCDYLIDKSVITPGFGRKFFTTVASIGPGIFCIAASYAGCERTLVVVLFCIAMSLMGTFYPGMKVNALDLASNYGGTIMAIVNGVGAITGIFTPAVAGLLTPNRTISEWRNVFWISFGVFVVTNIIFVVFGSAEEQWWNNPENMKKKDEENNKTNETSLPAENNKTNETSLPAQ